MLQAPFDPTQRRQIADLSGGYVRIFLGHGNVFGLVSQQEMSVASPDAVTVNVDQQIFFQLFLIEIGSQRKLWCFRIFDEQTP